ncbi:MAG TPA: redox-sensitive transcriptional activator SoxR [Acidimicrobiales bacterium]|jgi:MerR family redox-sensitive transcriptional activator SoxR
MTAAEMSIGEVADRSGLAPSALRFYEDQGLIRAERSPSGHRKYHRDVLRRVAFIRIAQRMGLSLDEITSTLSSLPSERTPTAEDWGRLSWAWTARLDDEISVLSRLRDQLTSCIGCGCLSLDSCQLYNPTDSAARLGPGPRFVLGERPRLADGGSRAHTSVDPD